MKIKDFFKNEKPIEAGIYHSRVTGEDGGNYRLHLRVMEGGNSILSINAARILHLNPTATEFAKLIVEGRSEDETVKIVKGRYRGVNKETLREEYRKLRDLIDSMSIMEDVCPITYLDVERIEPFSTPSNAPYRMDLALTYRCNNDCGHCYVDRDKGDGSGELTTDQWKRVMEKLWDLGIFHVAFTGGEATMRDDLPELVGTAEDLGMVAGLLTNGRRLMDKKYIGRLIEEGIDYFQITLESSDKKIHNRMVGVKGKVDAWDETVKGIKNAAKSPIHTITNTTITKHNVKTLSKTVDFIATLGVNAFAMNGIIYSGGAKGGEMAISEEALPEILQEVIDSAERNDLRFIWYTPTQYCKFNPVEMNLGMKQCTAGKFNMCIEPNGDALPCQSYYEPVGNILEDEWDNIWNHPLLISIRNREYIMDKCRECEELALCGGGCPLEIKHGEFICAESMSNP